MKKKDTINILIQNNILKKGTILECYFDKFTFGTLRRLRDEFLFLEVCDSDSDYILCNRILDNSIYKIYCEDIISIEGMSIDRILRAYDIKTSLDVKKKKRGRKPKEKM